MNDDVYYWTPRVARMTITVRFLGSSFNGNMNTISAPSFWNSYSGQEQVVRVLPLAESLPRIEEFDYQGYYRTYVAHGLLDGVGITGLHYMHIPHDYTLIEPHFMTSSYNIRHSSFPLRLFKNEYKTVR